MWKACLGGNSPLSDGMERGDEKMREFGGTGDERKLQANSMRDLIQPSKGIAISLPHSSGKARVFHFGCLVSVGSTRELE